MFSQYTIGLTLYFLGVSLMPGGFALFVIASNRKWKDETQKRLIYVFWSAFLVTMIGLIVVLLSPELWE